MTTTTRKQTFYSDGTPVEGTPAHDQQVRATAPTSYSTAITPRDFSTSVNDVNRDRWTVGTLAFVVEALNGQRVAIVTDNGTGGALVGVTLGKIVAGGSHSYRLHVTSTYESGETQTTAYLLQGLGAIIPLEQEPGVSPAKWRALDAHRIAQSEAIKVMRDAMPELDYGKWDATPIDLTTVDVTYTPQREGAGRRTYRRVVAGELRVHL